VINHGGEFAHIDSEKTRTNLVIFSATNMRKYFIKLENDHSVPVGTPGHGFSGFLDVTVNDDTLLANQSSAQTVLKSVASHLNQDPSNLFSLIHQDLNNASPDRDQQTGIFGFPAHRDLLGRRVSARNAVVEAENKTSKLKLQLTSLVTKVLFDTTGSEPKAKGVEYLFGKSMYGADPRYNASVTGITKRAFARKEVILSGGAFNSPQLLKLSGIGPAAELEKFGIPVLVDLPGVGANLQDNNEFGVIATAAQDFTSTAPACSYGAPGDPCLAAWEVEGTGPYAQGPLDAILYKTANASERDIFAWGTPSSYRGYWPSSTVNVVEPVDGPNTWGFAMVKMTPNATGKSAGTVMLRSKDPREVPDINFRFFENEPDNGLSELRAMADAVSFGRSILADIPPPLGPFVESFPCVNGAGTCDVEEVIKTQTWSHHATSTCAIGRDGDKMAVLDGAFKVRGVKGLRVVDASVFPRVPGAFPVVPVFMVSEKASELIARAGGFGA
jgi:choline dehydrogenase